MARLIFGNHSSVLVPAKERDNIRKFYCDVLGGRITKADDERDFLCLGDNFYIGFLYEMYPMRASGHKTEFEGQSTKLNDEFSIRSGDRHYSKQKLIEVIPGKKVVWLVTVSKLKWLKKNTEEWTNTKIVFEITPKGDKTELHFTHEGLIPMQECYTNCSKGWDMLIKEMLYNFMTKTKS